MGFMETAPTGVHRTNSALAALVHITLTILLCTSLTSSLQTSETLQVTHLEAHESTSGSHLPDVLDLSLQIDKTGDVMLNLTRNVHVSKDVPVYLGRSGRLTKYNESSGEDFAVYIDKTNQAEMLVQGSEEEGQINRKYRGSFRVGDKDYLLEPVEEPHNPRRRRRRDTNYDYVVYEISGATSVYDYDDNSRLNGTDFGGILDAVPDELPEGYVFDVPYQEYGVELLVVVDYSIFNKWFQRSQAVTVKDREREAVDNIRYYFSQVVNGMDLRYQTIDEPDFGLFVKLKAFLIATTPGDSPWTERYPNKESGDPFDFTNVYRALDDLERWLHDRLTDLPTFDHASVFSGNVLYDGYDNGKRRHINGLTNINGICDDVLKVALNRDRGHYASMQTATHELGHNLGSSHDGTRNLCTGKDQYLMASTPGVLTDINYKNAFTFSRCSRNAFRKFLHSLTRDEKNCLTNHIEDAVSPSLELAGQHYTLTMQCRHVLGPNSFYCGGEPNDKAMCRSLWCYSPKTKKCMTAAEMRAYEGTTCGHHKWCKWGDCVTSSDAPASKDYCLSGDFKGRFYDGRSCRDVISSQPWQCYKSGFLYSEKCCQSCSAIYDQHNPGCEYGDRRAYCSRITAKDCYQPRALHDCCATCQRFNRTIPSDPKCVYGDHASWCTTMPSSGCYQDRETCCESCITSRSSADCPWGDQATWCKKITPSSCYINHKICCETCRPRDILGCEYGDRDDACQESDCDDPYYRWLCCDTCQPRSSTQSTTLSLTTTTTTYKPTTTSTSTTISSTTGSSDCPTGDRSWCRLIPLRQCYFYESNCCETCQPIGPPGCLYGDRYLFCSSAVVDCNQTFYQRHCCETCASNPVEDEPDIVPPKISCPVLPEVIYVQPRQRRALVTWSSPRVQDEFCGTDVSVEISRPEKLKGKAELSSEFEEGRHVVEYTATDCNGNTNTCQIHVNVVVRRCAKPQRPVHGNLVCTSSDTVWGNSCTFSCQAGYRLQGDAVQLCLDRQRWSGGGTVTCHKVECGRPRQSADLELKQCTDGYKFGSACYFGCKHTLSRPHNDQGWVTCTASGTWTGQVESCRDMEKPIITGCPSDIFTYTDVGTRTAVVRWTLPVAKDRVDGSVDVVKLAGKKPLDSFPPGQHIISYTAFDNAGNEAEPCNFTITVQQIACNDIVPRENLQVTCPKGVIYGASCTFHCLNDYQLVGPAEANCDKTRTDPPTGVWNWGDYKHQPYCESCHGDEADWCTGMPDWDCYVSDDTCCETCRSRARPFASRGCKYGDRVSWCQRFIRGPEDCADSDLAETCCQACDQYLYPIAPDCVDDADWCPTALSLYCYDAKTRATCCKTCASRKRGPKGCEYGDKVSWCWELNDKQCETQTELCCSTCR